MTHNPPLLDSLDICRYRYTKISPKIGSPTEQWLAHIFNPSTQEAEAQMDLSLRPAWSTRASSRAGSKATERNPVSKKTKTKQNKKIGSPIQVLTRSDPA